MTISKMYLAISFKVSSLHKGHCFYLQYINARKGDSHVIKSKWYINKAENFKLLMP